MRKCLVCVESRECVCGRVWIKLSRTAAEYSVIYNTGPSQVGVCFQMLISVQSEMSPKDLTLFAHRKAANYIRTLQAGKKQLLIELLT